MNIIKLAPILILYIISLKTSYTQQVQLNGRVLEINSGQKPIPNVSIKSDNGANTVQSNSNGEYTLTFQDQGYGARVYIEVKKENYEVVNEKAMQLYLPNSDENQKLNLEIILCKAGYLDQARTAYYEISNTYVDKEYKKRYDAIMAKKEEGWQTQIEKLQEDMEVLRKQIEKQAEDYIRTNKDDLTEKELEARRLFDEGKIDESIELRESLNSEATILTAQKNIKIAKKNREKAQNIIAEADKEEETAKSKMTSAFINLNELAKGYVLQNNFEKAEDTYLKMVELDSINYDYVFKLAYFLADQNKDKEALSYYNKALILAKHDPEVALIQNNLGNLYSDLNNYEVALQSYQKALEIRKRLAKTNPERYESFVATTQNNLGSLYGDLNNYEAALQSYQEALEIRKRLAKTNPEKYESFVADTQNNLGNLYDDLNNYEAALQSHQEALEIRKRLAKTKPEKYEPYVARTQNNLGSLYVDLNNYEVALQSYQDALEIHKRLAKTNPEKYEPDVAVIQNNLGSLYGDLNNYEAALQSYQKALEIRKRLAQTNPEKYVSDVAATQYNLGILYRSLNNYEAALNSYQEAIEIYKRLAKTNPEKYDPYVATTQYNLGNLYRSLNNYEAASNSYQEALEIYKRLAKIYPEKYEPHVARTQNNLGILYSDLNNYEAALQSYQEALEIRKRLAKTNPEKYEIESVTSIVLIGFLQKQFNKGRVINGEELDLGLAKKIIDKYPDNPLANSLLTDLKDLQKFFRAYDIWVINEQLNTLEYSERIPLQKEVISKYHELYNLGYEYRFSIGYTKGSLAFYQLFAKDFKGAEQSAKEALNPTSFEKPDNYDQEIEWVNTNLALALLYQGKFEEAKKIYMRLKDKPYGDTTYKETFLEDLDALEKEGITHPDVQKIKVLLNN